FGAAVTSQEGSGHAGRLLVRMVGLFPRQRTLFGIISLPRLDWSWRFPPCHESKTLRNQFPIGGRVFSSIRGAATASRVSKAPASWFPLFWITSRRGNRLRRFCGNIGL